MPPRKNKPSSRFISNFARTNIATRRQRDRILIVCEDSKTEPYYFVALCADYGLTKNLAAVKKPNVNIFGKECASSPGSVYNFAKQELEKDIKFNGIDNSYDRVYCVFDKDPGHKDYLETLHSIHNNSKHDGKLIIAANSIPCFEIWALLHFKPFTAPLKNSKETEKLLQKYIKKYSKKHTKNLYPYLRDKTNIAIKNAKHVLKEVKKAGTDNPSTYIHILVEDLIEQSKK